MLNQKLNPTPSEDLTIDVDLLYETDPCELKLDEMIEAEPEPEMIEGLPASDALTPADRYLELFEHVQSTKLFPDSKTFPDCAPKMDPLDILIRYRKVRRHRDFDLRRFVENHFWLPETLSSEYVSNPENSLKEHIDQLWPILTREPQDIFRGLRCWRCRNPISCREAVLAKPIIGTLILPCWVWRKAGAKTYLNVWRIISPG